jgi:hypothetical protein
MDGLSDCRTPLFSCFAVRLRDKRQHVGDAQNFAERGVNFAKLNGQGAETLQVVTLR